MFTGNHRVQVVTTTARLGSGRVIKKRTVMRYTAANLPTRVPENFNNAYNSQRKRDGKTARDHADGCARRAADNKMRPIRRTSSGSLPNAGQDSRAVMGG